MKMWVRKFITYNYQHIITLNTYIWSDLWSLNTKKKRKRQKIFSKISISLQIFYFYTKNVNSPKFPFLTKNFDQHFDFWPKSSHFDQNFDFWQKIHVLTKMSIFHQKLFDQNLQQSFYQKFHVLTNIILYAKILIFHKSCYFT